MTTYETIRCIGILVGPTLTLVLGGLIAWIIRTERKSSRAEAMTERAYALYEKNIPELHEKDAGLERRIATIEKRLSIYQIQSGPTKVTTPVGRETA